VVGNSKKVIPIILTKGQVVELSRRAKKAPKKYGGPLSRSELVRRIVAAALKDKEWLRDAMEAGK